MSDATDGGRLPLRFAPERAKCNIVCILPSLFFVSGIPMVLICPQRGQKSATASGSGIGNDSLHLFFSCSRRAMTWLERSVATQRSWERCLRKRPSHRDTVLVIYSISVREWADSVSRAWSHCGIHWHTCVQQICFQAAPELRWFAVYTL